MRASILLSTLIFLTACSTTTVEIYCPVWPTPTDAERADLAERIEDGSPAFTWFQRLYVLRTELKTCEEQAAE